MIGLLQWVGLAATVVTCLQIALQIRDVWRADAVAGVSTVTWLLALVQAAGLFVYASAERFIAAAATNAAVTVLCSVVVISLALRRHQWRPLGGLAAALVFVAAVSVLFGAPTSGTLGAVASLFVWIPQAVRSVRKRTAEGLSRGMVLAGFASSLLWIAYALLLDEWRLLVPPLSAVSALLVMVVFAFGSQCKGQDTRRGETPYGNG